MNSVIRYLVLFVMFFSGLSLSAQEPATKVGMNIQDLIRSYPDIVKWGYERNGCQDYKSIESDILLTTKKGIVIQEFFSIEGIPGDDGYLSDLFRSIVQKFSQPAKHYLWGSDHNSITFFYSYYSVYISHTPYNNVSVMYSLADAYWPK